MTFAELKRYRPDKPCQLLVSVRNPVEAWAALDGGADILDVKEPAHGSLGAAANEVIHEVAEALPSRDDKSIPLSAALGELRDFQSPPLLPAACRWVKLGLSELAGDDWRVRWQSTRQSIARQNPQTHLIPVIYADWKSCSAPGPQDVIGLAQESESPGILIDTWEKKGQSLLDFFSLADLAQLIESIHVAECFAVLAGSLRCEQLADLVELRPDILAVRSAACIGGRQGTIDAGRVAMLKRTIASAFISAQKLPLTAGPPAR